MKRAKKRTHKLECERIVFFPDEPEERWSICDATHEHNRAALASLSAMAFPHDHTALTATVDLDDLRRVLSLAEEFRFLCTYPRGTKSVVEKLTLIRRALRAEGKA